MGNLLKTGYTLERAYEEFCINSRKRVKELQASSDFIKNHCPDYGLDIVRQANQFMAGKMVLCGTGGRPYYVGNPPKWMENPLHDNEFVWQLNRMEHWITLVRAYYLTGETKYVEKMLDEWENWMDTCPPLEITTDYKTAKARFSSVHPWRSLEVGIRAHGSWNICLEAISGLKALTPEFFEKVLKSLHRHGTVLYTVCPVIWPEADHNHYLTECLGLLAVSGMLPYFPESEQWNHHAAAELERCVRKQVPEGGGQIEGCPTYHHECLLWLTHSLDLAGRYGIRFSEEYTEKIRSMFHYGLYASRPDGSNVPWGDSDALPQIYKSALHMYGATGDLEPLEQCARFFDKNELIAECYRQAWDLERPEALIGQLRDESFGSGAKGLPTVNWNRALKQVMMRTGWDKNAASIFFACRTPVHNDHAHIDPNGFDYFNQGVPILVDPGRFNYQEGPDRKLFKGGSYHNTLLISQRDAFEYLGTWAYGEQQIGDILNVGRTGDLDYVCGCHANYFPVIHTRMLAFNHDVLVVIDRVDNRKEDDQVNLYYHLNAPGESVKEDMGLIRADVKGKAVCISYSDNMTASLLEGRASSYIDHADQTTRIQLNSCDGSRVFLTIVSVGDGGQEIELEDRKDSLTEADIRFAAGNKRYHVVWKYGENILEKK